MKSLREQAQIVSLSGLCFGYAGSQRAVLQDLSLEIPSGAITAILGPNGSGKTTLLRLILGSLSPRQGQILLAERPQAHYSRQEMSRLVGLVPQAEHIPFEFSALEYVLLGRAPYLKPLAMPGQADRQIALNALQTMGSTHLQDRPVTALSGGEQQLVIIARALAQKPRLLLLDEPTSHLDLGNKGRILQMLRALRDEGVSLVLTTHDPNIAAQVANFVVLMRQGQVLSAGPPDSVLTSEGLSATFRVPVQVFQAGQRRAILLA
jgi:iron complex transport system ATP-binding protein